jgi:predicted oxidoreductase
MPTRIRELPAPAVAGGLALLGGVALWQIGIEFERAWIRTDGGPLIGEHFAGETSGVAGGGHATAAVAERRRWVDAQQPRVAPRIARIA